MTKFLLYIPLLVGLRLIPALGWADFQAGQDAYERGDYDTALKEWRPLADQGDVKAQFNLGQMYRRGQGVPQDVGEGVRWYRLAADQGLAGAQLNMGAMDYDGKGVQQDFIQAYMWVTLSVNQGFEPANELLETLETKMTPAQIAEAQRLAREWKAKGK